MINGKYNETKTERDLLSARRHSFIGSDPLVLRDSRETRSRSQNTRKMKISILMWGLLHRGRCVCVCVCDILLAETQKKDSHFVTIEKDIEEQKEKKTKRVDSSEKNRN